MTTRCEHRARDWDQRSAARAGELQALAGALAVLKDGTDGMKSVRELDAINNRTVLLQPAARKTPQLGSRASLRLHDSVHAVAGSATAPSFLQSGARRGDIHGQPDKRLERAAEFAHQEGARLNSQVLSAISTKIMSDPFDKVKQLIQKLIERLLNEAAQEATKKGFCDTEVGKAKQDRDSRFEEITTLASEVHELEIKKDELSLSVTELTDGIPELYARLNETTEQREAEREDNLDAIKLSKEGVDAVAQAITVLKVYYKKALTASVLMQASPVDEDTQGPGFEGAYRGRQDSAGGIIGLLEVIKADFDRTGRHTAQAEKDAQAEFVKFERTSKSDIAAKEMTLQLNQQELNLVSNRLEKKVEDLKTTQALLDDALKVLENLKPMCIDTSMTYAERATKREEEVAALKRALCILDPDGKEPSCAASAVPRGP